MNIIDKIKLLFSLKSVGQEIYGEATHMDGIKPGWKTSEFWAKILTVDVPMILGALKGIVPPQIAAWTLLGSNVAWIAARAWTKRAAIVTNLKAFLDALKGGDTSKLQALVDALTVDPTTVTTTVQTGK